MSLFDDQIDRASERDASPETGTVTAPLTDLTPDDRNANAGTARGRAMVEESLRRFGAGRSILADKFGRIIAGNTTHEAAIDIGLADAVIVKTDGTKLVVVQRTDLDLDDPVAQALAAADNRSSELGLRWNTGRLAELAADEAIDLSMMFSNVELADLLGADAPVPRFEPEAPPIGSTNSRRTPRAPPAATSSSRSRDERGALPDLPASESVHGGRLGANDAALDFCSGGTSSAAGPLLGTMLSAGASGRKRTLVGAIVFGRGASAEIGSPFGLRQDQICELCRVALGPHRGADFANRGVCRAHAAATVAGPAVDRVVCAIRSMGTSACSIRP